MTCLQVGFVWLQAEARPASPAPAAVKVGKPWWRLDLGGNAFCEIAGKGRSLNGRFETRGGSSQLVCG